MEKEIEDLLADIAAQRERVLDIQRSVERMEITGYAGGGDVTARLRGTGEFAEVCIDPQAVRRYGVEAVGGLVAEAVNDALRKLGDASRRRFAPMLAEAES
jgi:nucleoid-associated protein EbfC